MHGETWEQIAMQNQFDKMRYNTTLHDTEQPKVKIKKGREKHIFNKQTWEKGDVKHDK